jgi:hypothetical protein
MEGLTIGNWIGLIALGVAVVSASIAFANYVANHRERREKGRPRIQATINAAGYEGGWRSVQLHVVPLDEDQRDFRIENWRIERAKLLRPKTAVLARAADDDYASGIFYPEHPVRTLEGRTPSSPQRQFALEFFIRFSGAKHGQTAVFKVTFSHLKTGKRFTAKARAS